MGNFPRVMQPRFLGAAYETLMELERPPEHVRSKGNKQSEGKKMLVAQPASWHNTLEMAPPASQAAGQPQRTAVAPRDRETMEESRELRERHFALYQRGKEVCL